ncbi:hypothetical protein NEHOM01_2421 [Nematocida homosporus]|uniref:uncharacterized protein n=1 Tax=Nematocida homosporus TaxID=1912981 RepID=UPI002220AABE|nr:uncharacterized protein NEHOM01_2421 [Nematocida homosporus]KAI5187877.1 hypothetical protein NEHOM01_2421 [Nematocida homosporus]
MLTQLQNAQKLEKETELFIKQAIETKRRSIESKEKLVELIDMLVINRINMVEELEFTEKRSRILPQAPSTSIQPKIVVADLIKIFECPEPICKPTTSQ